MDSHSARCKHTQLYKKGAAKGNTMRTSETLSTVFFSVAISLEIQGEDSGSINRILLKMRLSNWFGVFERHMERGEKDYIYKLKKYMCILLRRTSHGDRPEQEYNPAEIGKHRTATWNNTMNVRIRGDQKLKVNAHRPCISLWPT